MPQKYEENEAYKDGAQAGDFAVTPDNMLQFAMDIFVYGLEKACSLEGSSQSSSINLSESETVEIACDAELFETVEEKIIPEPVYQEPVYQQPVYQEPAHQEPVYQEPMHQEKEEILVDDRYDSRPLFAEPEISFIEDKQISTTNEVQIPGKSEQGIGQEDDMLDPMLEGILMIVDEFKAKSKDSLETQKKDPKSLKISEGEKVAPEPIQTKSANFIEANPPELVINKHIIPIEKTKEVAELDPYELEPFDPYSYDPEVFESGIKSAREKRKTSSEPEPEPQKAPEEIKSVAMVEPLPELIEPEPIEPETRVDMSESIEPIVPETSLEDTQPQIIENAEQYIPPSGSEPAEEPEPSNINEVAEADIHEQNAVELSESYNNEETDNIAKAELISPQEPAVDDNEPDKEAEQKIVEQNPVVAEFLKRKRLADNQKEDESPVDAGIEIADIKAQDEAAYSAPAVEESPEPVSVQANAEDAENVENIPEAESLIEEIITSEQKSEILLTIDPDKEIGEQKEKSKAKSILMEYRELKEKIDANRLTDGASLRQPAQALESVPAEKQPAILNASPPAAEAIREPAGEIEYKADKQLKQDSSIVKISDSVSELINIEYKEAAAGSDYNEKVDGSAVAGEPFSPPGKTIEKSDSVSNLFTFKPLDEVIAEAEKRGEIGPQAPVFKISPELPVKLENKPDEQNTPEEKAKNPIIIKSAQVELSQEDKVKIEVKPQPQDIVAEDKQAGYAFVRIDTDKQEEKVAQGADIKEAICEHKPAIIRKEQIPAGSAPVKPAAQSIPAAHPEAKIIKAQKTDKEEKTTPAEKPVSTTKNEAASPFMREESSMSRKMTINYWEGIIEGGEPALKSSNNGADTQKSDEKAKPASTASDDSEYRIIRSAMDYESIDPNEKRKISAEDIAREKRWKAGLSGVFDSTDQYLLELSGIFDGVGEAEEPTPLPGAGNGSIPDYRKTFLKYDVDYYEKHDVKERQAPREQKRIEATREGLTKREEFDQVKLEYKKNFSTGIKTPGKLCSYCGAGDNAKSCYVCNSKDAGMMTKLCDKCANDKTVNNCINCGRPNSKIIARICDECAPEYGRICIKCASRIRGV